MNHNAGYSAGTPRFAVNDIVYFVSSSWEGGASESRLQIMKGTICAIPAQARTDDPRVRVWPNLDEPPSGIPIKVGMEADTLLTGRDVQGIALELDGFEEVVSAEEAIKAHHDDIAIAIGALVFLRQLNNADIG